MRITELFTAQSIALDEAQQDRSQIIDRLVELQEGKWLFIAIYWEVLYLCTFKIRYLQYSERYLFIFPWYLPSYL